jgi:HD superfamily phosphodiesterase
MIETSILTQIKEYALAMDWLVAFRGKSFGNAHLSRVVTIAGFLAEKEKARKDICEAGAWLHDIGLIVGNDDNPTKIRSIAEKYLATLSLNEDYLRRIAEAVETHEGVSAAVSLEAMIVHDADALDKMGMLGVIRHTWKIVKLINPRASSQEIFLVLQKHLKERKNNLYTSTAKMLVRDLNKALNLFFADTTNALQTIEMIMYYVKMDFISDEIAGNLLLYMDDQSLMHQLRISHEILQRWYERNNTDYPPAYPITSAPPCRSGAPQYMERSATNAPPSEMTVRERS